MSCRFERCHFSGHFSLSADYIACTFTGKIDGCVWYGTVPAGDVDVYRHNVITGNDFTGATSGPFSEVKKEGVGFETHGDVAATIVFKSVGG